MSKQRVPEVFELDVPMTQSRFGQLVGVSQSAVSEMQARGTLPAEETGHVWLLAYCEHLRAIAAGRMSESGDDGLTAERTRLTKEQADAQEMKNAVTRGELAPVVVLEETLEGAAARVAAVFEAIPGKIRRRLPDLPMAAVRIVTDEIGAARKIVAAMQLPVPGAEDGTDEEADDSKD